MISVSVVLLKRKALTSSLQKYILAMVYALEVHKIVVENYAADCEGNDVYDDNEFDVDVTDENCRPAADDNDVGDVCGGDDVVMM